MYEFQKSSPIRKIIVNDMTIGPGEHTFFVAEEGQANDGDFNLALKMVAIAAAAKVDAIEFQLAIADDFYIRSHPIHPIYARRQFSRRQLNELLSCICEAGIVPVATVFSSRLVQDLVDLGCPLFNISSCDIDNPEILDSITETGRPFFISTAMATQDDVDWAVDRVQQHGATSFALLHGQHTMTTDNSGVPENQAHLAVITTMRARYRAPVGFIDHTSNLYMPSIAAASGTDVVTKHFTWDRLDRGPDWQICLEPGELAEAVRLVRLVDQTVGRSVKALVDGEQSDCFAMRRSIVSAMDLPIGTKLRREHIAFKRPGIGLSPKRINEVLNRCLRVSLSADDVVRLEDLS